MKFLDRVKNLFTEPEDPEDEIQIEQITRDGSKISVDTKPNVEPKEQKVERERIVEIEQESRTRDLEAEKIVEPVQPKIEEEIPVEQTVQIEKPKPTREQLKTPIFFTEDEFDDLEPERPKVQPKPVEKRKIVEPVRPQVRKEEKKAPYSGTYTSTSILTKEKPTFKPTPIISPIYGILDKNYSKDDIVERKESKEKNNVTRNDKFDEVRNKAYGNKLENDLENTIYDKTETLKKHRVEKEIDLFDELEDEPQNYNPKEEVSLSDTTELAKSVSEQEKNIRELDEVTMDLTKELDNLLLKRESYNQKKEDFSSKSDDELLTENEVFNFIDSIYEDGKE